VSSNPGHRAVG